MSDVQEEKEGSGGGKRRGPSPKATAPVNPEPSHEGLFLSLVDLFEEGFPDKVVLNAVFGPSGKRRGPVIKEFPFKAGEKPSREDLVGLTNTIVRIAQEECEVFGKSSNFGVFAYDVLRSSDYYRRKTFNLKPEGTSQLLAEERGETDFEDEEGGGGGSMSVKLLMSILDGERRDKRWVLELAMNAITGAAQRDAERIASLEEQVDGIYERSIKYIAATEEMLNQSADRKARAERATMVNELMREGVDTIRKTLVPAIAVYLSKGKVGVVQGIREFLDSLTEETKHALFGHDDEPGVLTEEQGLLIAAIADGEEDPKRLVEFVQSITPVQAQTIMERQLLSFSQIQQLQALSKAVTDVANKEAAEAAAAGTATS